MTINYQDITKQDRVGLLSERLFQHENDHFVSTVQEAELRCEPEDKQDRENFIKTQQSIAATAARKIEALREMRDSIKAEPDPQEEESK